VGFGGIKNLLNLLLGNLLAQFKGNFENIVLTPDVGSDLVVGLVKFL
jgi:hypothetical protein